MTKQNIIDIVSGATGLTKVETEAVMNGVMKTIISSLAKNDRVEFILRNAAVFKFKIGKITEEYIQIDSDKEVPFMTAIRFEIKEDRQGSIVTVYLETDTSPVMDFTFEV